MSRRNTNDIKKGREMPWTYGVEEYKETFSKTRENTACGPSGIHMGHWKAALEINYLMKIHSFFIWSVFTFGHSYKRLEVSIHCMIQKKDDPYSQKLRIIQLFEGDFNGALKYIIGRRLMKYVTKNNGFYEDIYGSRSGKTAIEALINIQLIFDHHRI